MILEQNYRSTPTILNVARSVIAANGMRKEKNLWTENSDGVPVTVHEAFNEQDEALYVVREIERLHKTENVSLDAFAIMYRTNAQSRAIEDAFVRYGMPYRLVGGTASTSARDQRRAGVPAADPESVRRGQSASHHQRAARGIGQKTVQELNALVSQRPARTVRGVARRGPAAPTDAQDPVGAQRPVRRPSA